MLQQTLQIHALEGSIGKRVRATWEGNLQKLNWEQDFLAPFRSREAKGGYIGLGKTLSGLLHAARYFGGEADELRRKIVAEILSTQEPEGYMGLYEPSSRTSKVWDVHEQAYLLQALVENAQWFEDAECLQAAQRLGHWLLPRLSQGAWSEVGKGYVWNTLAIIGLDRAFDSLSRVSKDPTFAAFNRDEIGLKEWFEPIIENRQGEVCGHAYAYLARSLAQLETDETAPLPDSVQAVIAYLRGAGGLVISGTCGHHECWHSDQRLDGHLGETCTTAYLVRWSAHLLHRTHQAWFGDLMERAIYNALFAASDREGRRIRYYSAGEGQRKWYEVDTYCCPGNYRRILGELPYFIARPHLDGLAIDLYESSRLTVGCKNQKVDLHLKSKVPFANTVSIEVGPERAANFPIHLRHPGWAKEVRVSLNGKGHTVESKKGWITLQRDWQPGDKIELVFEMPWRLIRGLRLQKNKVALMRGPLVWGADPADNQTLCESLTQVVINPTSCQLVDENERASVQGHLAGQPVEVFLKPFSDLDTAVTYFAGRPDMGDESDHLLWLATDPIGVGPAPGT
jgi:uncharacterized protein